MEVWKGQFARIDLTHKSFKIDTLPESLLKVYLGGRGLGVKLYFDEVNPEIDPLDEDNKIVIAAGALCGTGASGASMASVVTKSPLTNTICCGRIRGYFGTELKFAGFDAVIIEGKAEHPVIIFISHQRISIKPALEYGQQVTSKTEKMIKEELNDRWKALESFILSVGPAGENKANLATLVSDGLLLDGGAGIGAIFGAKNLKAIVISGSQDVTVNQGEKCLQSILTLKNKFNTSPYTKEYLPNIGNGFLLDICLDKKALPANNFKSSAQKIPNLDGDGIKNFTQRRRACFSCPIGCIRFSLEKQRMLYLDYESMAGFGYLCGIKTIDKIAELRYLCTELGLDVLNTASTIACAMELSEEGILKDVSLSFGSEDIEKIIKQIGKNKGFGAEIAKGGAHLAKALNRPDRFMGVKNSAIPPFEPRKLWGFGLHLATSNSGAYHLNGFTIIEELLGIHQVVEPFKYQDKPALVKQIQDTMAVLDALGYCVYILLALKLNNILPFYKFCFNTEVNIQELLNLGERIWNLERIFNIKAGIDYNDDVLPKRFTQEALEGNVCPLDQMLPVYYQERGWDKWGKPKEDILNRLGLKDAKDKDRP